MSRVLRRSLLAAPSSLHRPQTSLATRFRSPFQLTQATLSTSATFYRKMESNNADLEISKLFNVQGRVALVTGGGRFESAEYLTTEANGI